MKQRTTKDLLDNEIYPRIHARADVLFPDFKFRKVKVNDWEATLGEMNGSAADGKLYYYADRPFGFKFHKDGTFLTIWDYVQDRDQLSGNREVLERLAEMAQYPLPELTLSPAAMERLEQDRRRTKILTAAAAYFTELLYAPEGATTLAYLTERGFSEELARQTRLGHYPGRDATVSHLESLGFSESHALTAIKYLTVLNRDDYALAIPYPDAQGRIVAIYGRLTRPPASEGEHRYLPLSEATDGVRAAPFLLSDARREKRLVLVEGYLDALLPAAHGVGGVVALGGMDLTRAHLETLKAETKVRSLVFALDSDKAGREGTMKGVQAATEAGFSVFVLEYPGGDERKIDAYDFVRERGPEAFVDLVHNASSGAKWLTRTVLSEYNLETDLGRSEALDAITPFEETLRDAVEREELRKTVSEALGLSLEALKERFGAYHEKKAKERGEKALRDALRTAETRLEQGDAEGARTSLEEGVRNSKPDNVRVVSSLYTLDSVKQLLAARDSGLATGYPSLDEILTIRPALTFIGGRPSHGKTAFLLNLLVNMLRDERNASKVFYFFSYEEDVTLLSGKLFAMMSEAVVNPHKNTEQIEQYVRYFHGTSRRPLSSWIDTENELRLLGALQEYEEYVQAGRLRIVFEPLSVQGLRRFLEYAREEHEIGAVLVDYVQRVKCYPDPGEERLRMVRVSDELRQASTDLSLPIIAGAQFNRKDTDVPRLDGLKESGSLEEDANTVLGIYNLRTAKTKERRDTEKDGSPKELKNCNGQPARTEDNSAIDFEVHVLKNRGGPVNGHALLRFNGPTLRISEWEAKSNGTPRDGADRNDTTPF